MGKEDLSTMTVAELKVRLKELGLTVSGRKADLIDRLVSESVEEEEGDLLILDDEDEEDIPHEEPVLEAEIFEAEIIEAEIPAEVRMTPAPRVAQPWFRDGTNIATVLVVILLAGAGGWWYISQQEVVYQVSPARYGDDFRFTVSEGLLLAEGDEMVEHLRERSGGWLDEVCGQLRIDFTGTGSASITEGSLADLKDPSDTHLEGAVMTNGAYGRTWNAVESKIEYDLDADLSGYTWSAINPDACSQSTEWSRNNHEIEIGVEQWTELTESGLLRTDTTVDYRSGDGEHSAVSMTTFGVISGSETVADLMEAALMPVHPIDLYEMFGLTVLEEGMTGEHNGWDWRVGTTTSIGDADAIMVYMAHDTIAKCLGRASITLWVIPDQPLPGRQKVDLMLDGQGAGGCALDLRLAIEYAFPDGSFTSKYTMEQTSFSQGGDLLDWSESYATRPLTGQGVPGASDRVPWNAGTHMWDNSTTRAFTLEKAVACVIADGANFTDGTDALNADGYVFAAQDNRSANMPTWNLSWVSSGDSGWVRVTWPGGEGCLNTGDGPLSGDERPEHGRNRIPSTLLLSAVEARMTSSTLYPELNARISNVEVLRDDTNLGYVLVIPEDNPLTDLLGDYLDGKVTVIVERTWTEGGEEHTLRAAMDGETGRMAGWILTTTS
jgi:hypothetical protein